MLEKNPIVTFFYNLMGILLIEVHFNFVGKLIIGVCIMVDSEKGGMISLD